MPTTLPFTAAQALARYAAADGRIGMPQVWVPWGKRGAQQSVGNTNDCCYAFTWATGDRRGADSELRNGSIRAYRADRKHPEPVFLGPDVRHNLTVAQLRGKIRPGDGVCFRWNPAAGGTPDHIGIFVRWEGDTLVTREANTGPRPGVAIPCGMHLRRRTASQVQGIIRPPYAPAAPKHAAPAKPPAKGAGSVSKRTYVVRPGDTLATIGAALKIDWKRIASTNRIAAPYVIYPKQELILP